MPARTKRKRNILRDLGGARKVLSKFVRAAEQTPSSDVGGTTSAKKRNRLAQTVRAYRKKYGGRRATRMLIRDTNPLLFQKTRGMWR